MVNDLFCTLPVRRKLLEKNYKREFSKAISLLQAYATISTNKRFMVYHQTKNSGKLLQLSTNSNKDMKLNIMNVFGTKVSSSLIPWNDGIIEGC